MIDSVGSMEAEQLARLVGALLRVVVVAAGEGGGAGGGDGGGG